MNYQCQFIIRDELTNIKYESPRHAFFHNQDTIALKWKGESIIITNTTIQTFHVYLEPYVLNSELNLSVGRIHWYSGRLYQCMKNESTKIKLLGTTDRENIFVIQHVRITLFFEHLKKHAHQLNCIVQFIRPWRRCIFVGRAQHISETMDEKRVYSWLPQKENQVAFPGIRMLQETNGAELSIMGALLSPKRINNKMNITNSMPDNPYFSNIIRTLPITVNDETVVEFKFYNVDQFLFEVVVKKHMLKGTKLREVVNEFFVFELHYNSSTDYQIVAMKLHVLLFKVALNMEHNKHNLTI
jgi:hypothetical protein